MKYIHTKLTIIILLGAFSANLSLKAQDRHFSQMYFNPLELSPSNAGLSSHDLRLSAMCRGQWSEAVEPYETTAISMDTKLLKNKLSKGNIIGIGLQFVKDCSGDVAYNTTELKMSMAYSRALNRKANTFISFGASLGYATESFDTDKAIFGNQIQNGIVSDFSSSAERNLNSENQYLDFSAGASFSHLSKSGAALYGGIQLAHLNAPNVSMFENNVSSLASLTKIYLGGEVNLNNKIGLVMRGLYMKQQQFDQLAIASMVKFYFNKSSKMRKRNSTYKVLYLGLTHRFNDAEILTFRYDIGMLSFAMSYDITVSDFATANSNQGAMEIGLSYQMSRKTNKRPILCPRM